MSSYGGFVERLARRVEARFSEIEAVFNFDFGDEFELAVCKVLEAVLPQRFGVCRGFVVDEGGKKAGDDVIIYDRATSPTLRSGAGLDFAAKEQIPVDSVYAYIECKHAVSDDAVLTKALKQVRSVKKLLLARPERAFAEYEVDGPVYRGKSRDWPRPLPPLKNAPFCAVFARSYDPKLWIRTPSDKYAPDLLILGPKHLATQSAVLGPDGIKGALFFDPKCGYPLRVEEVPNNAYGIGLVTLIQAVSWVELVPIDWGSTLNAAYFDALNRKK